MPTTMHPKCAFADPKYVDSENEDFYHEDDEVAETYSQKLIDDFVTIGKYVSDDASDMDGSEE
jgi:hypothetical protein